MVSLHAGNLAHIILLWWRWL